MQITHHLLQLIAPAVLAAVLFSDRWLAAYITMISTMAVDLDHLLSRPVYKAGRCSIGFHPLHSLPFLAIYPLLLFVAETRLIGLGLVVHMLVDSLDCWLMRAGERAAPTRSHNGDSGE